MSDTSPTGILYTEYSNATSAAPGISSLWSFETQLHSGNRPKILSVSGIGTQYWLERTDPLLNTILPGTGLSLIVNWSDLWAAGYSLSLSSLLPRVCVVGAVTKSMILKLGKNVRAVGIGFPATFATNVLGVSPADLVDRIVPLQDLWPRKDVDQLLACDSVELKARAEMLAEQALGHISKRKTFDNLGWNASDAIRQRFGNVGIEDLACSFGLDRRQFARRFYAATGLSPKLFSRISRFQTLVHALLSTDVAQWAALSTAQGFYDQSHMINEFRAFAGSSPTSFFMPEGLALPSRLRGRPSDWIENASAN